jgi:hypothetical protein
MTEFHTFLKSIARVRHILKQLFGRETLKYKAMFSKAA